MHCSFSHAEVVELSSLAEPSLLEEIDQCDDNVSLEEELAHEVYSLIHFGTSESHSAKQLTPLNLIETQRYFKNAIVCYRCKEVGHMMSECNETDKQVCSLCGNTHHKKYACPQRVCRLCAGLGHQPDCCPKRQQRHKIVCAVCGSRFHSGADCTEYRKQVKVHEPREALQRSCSKCGELGHLLSSCTQVQGLYSSTFFVEPLHYNGALLPAHALNTETASQQPDAPPAGSSHPPAKTSSSQPSKPDQIPKKGRKKNRK